jgi:PAS domain S-box-containing protein
MLAPAAGALMEQAIREDRGIDPEEGPVSRAERQLAAAQSITHVGSWEWDARSNAVRWSDELYRIYGLAPRSVTITFDGFLARLHPEDRDRVRVTVGRALESGETFAYTERIFQPDGTMRVLDTVGEPLRDREGAIVGLIGTCRDVTEERARDEQIRLYADLVRNVQMSLSVWSVGDPHDADTVRLVAYNPASERLTRLSLDAFVGRTLRDVVPDSPGVELEAIVLAVAQTGTPRESLITGPSDPRYRARSFSIQAFALPNACVGLAIEDITAQTMSRRMREAEQRVFELTAEGRPLAEILETLALAIEEHSPPTIASILLLGADGHLHLGAAPRLPAEYSRAVERIPIGPETGSCGTAAFTRKAVLVSDIETDPLWRNFRDLARSAGVRACWSTPILDSEQHVLGTFALYYEKPRAPEARDLALIARATHIAGLAIERRGLEDELRALSGHIESVREQERTGIAREIHDELGQALTALKMDLAWIGRRVGEPGQLSREALLEKIAAMSAMTDDVIDQVRRISAELRPGVLDDLGLVAALEWQAQEFERRTGATCLVRSNLKEDARLSRSVSTALFRIFQEALTNVARHGEASSVEVTLEEADGIVSLEVGDDGKGIPPEAISDPRSLGLLGIRERARRLGGTATVTGAPSRGTVVSVRVPRAAIGSVPP